MATALFNSVIFGPIKSRRLGVSLGVNLPPSDGKICNFDCIYCECGWNADAALAAVKEGRKLRFAASAEVVEQLGSKLKDMKESGDALDVITFAGNGEPTMHPDFLAIIDEVIKLRDSYYPTAKIAVLSNATMLARVEVRKALEKVDRALLKIDSAIPATIDAINQPQFKYSLSDIIANIKLFKGEVIIQTMFLRGEYNGVMIDNTAPVEIAAWLDVLKELNPSLVMIYSLDRDTPADNLVKVELGELEEIAKLVSAVGIECSFS